MSWSFKHDSNHEFVTKRSVADNVLHQFMEMSWNIRHDLNIFVKVSQIDRPSSGLQDLIRTPTGKDYGTAKRSTEKILMICLRHHRRCMACMIDRREGG